MTTPYRTPADLAVATWHRGQHPPLLRRAWLWLRRRVTLAPSLTTQDSGIRVRVGLFDTADVQLSWTALHGMAHWLNAQPRDRALVLRAHGLGVLVPAPWTAWVIRRLLEAAEAVRRSAEREVAP